MPTKIVKALRDYSDSELRALNQEIKATQEKITVPERGLQTPEFWNLQADRVKILQETEWRKRRGAVIE